jgi:tRNA-splicing ligase RtcB (3'-phosphate/5'-hydroxy nucleic acid ligase)
VRLTVVPPPSAVRVSREPQARRWTPSVFESGDTPADPALLERLEQSVRGMDLAAPPVVLPDFHHKRNVEMPSSIAIATRETIRPTLTSAAVNCGMALMAFDTEQPSERALSAFFTSVRERLPYPSGNQRDLTSREVARCALDGARFAAERFDINPADLDRIEEGGRLDLEAHGGIERARRQLPWLLIQLSRFRFATIGPSNHFIELQRVEEVYEPDTARKLGIAVGQLTLQYHGGGGVLTGTIGRLFGRRVDYPRKHRVVMALQKPLYHLASARSVEELRTRLALYFRDGCPPVPRYSHEGDRLLLANALAMNYGFAFRLATYAALRGIAREVLGTNSDRLIVDSPHDSLYEEEFGGESVVMHRHNSSRAFPASKMAGHPVFASTGQPVLLPGSNRTSSFLCVAAEDAAAALHTTCHGTGTIIAGFAQRGLSGADPRGRSTLRFRYDTSAPERVPHLDDRGVGEGLNILVRNGIVRPVARMRPIAGMN